MNRIASILARVVGGERGAALITVLMCLLLLMTFGLALVLTASAELLIAGEYRSAVEGLYGAEAGLERALQDLVAVPDWNTILTGLSRSTFVDGAPTGVRILADGSKVDLAQATNVASCRKMSTCSRADMDAVTEERPWGTNNPQWTPYAHGFLNQLLPTPAIGSPFYVITWVGDDPSENDGDPTTDGSAQTNPGRGVIALRSEAFGPGATHRIVEATVARNDSGTLRMLSWRQVR